MVRERRTSVPGEGHSSGELAGVERGGRSGYQFAGGRIRPQGQEQFQQISEHQGGYQSGGRSGYQSGRRGGHTGGRGGRGPPAPQAQRYYAGPEFQQKGGNHQQYPRGGATPQPGPSRPRSSDLHQATVLPYQVAPNNSKLPFWSPRESVGDDSSSSHATQQHPVGDATPQPRGGRPLFVGPSRLQYPDLHQAISPYQPPYRSAPSTSKAPFGSPTKYLGDDTSSQAPQQHPRGDAKPQPRGGEPPYGGSTSLSPDLHQAISPYQPTNLPAPTTSKKMVNGGIVNHWICVNFASRVNECTAFGFCQELAKICSNSGMTFEHKPVMLPITAYSNEVESVLKAIFEYAMTRLQGKELDLLIVILPDKNGSLNGDLKRICKTDLGLVYQCCLAEQVLKDRQKQHQYLVNLSLKINVKVGGRNTVLADAPCIEGEGEEEGHVFPLKH